MSKFIKKVWNTGDDVLPADLNRHEEGIYNNEQLIGGKSVAKQILDHNKDGAAHQNIQEQINVLSDRYITYTGRDKTILIATITNDYGNLSIITNTRVGGKNVPQQQIFNIRKVAGSNIVECTSTSQINQYGSHISVFEDGGVAKVYLVTRAYCDEVSIEILLNNHATILKTSDTVSPIGTKVFDGATQTRIFSTTDKTCVNKVITTREEVDNPNLPSGIYSIENVRDDVLNASYYMLIVNKHRLNPGYGSQVAIPYDGGQNRGMFHRNCSAGTWQPFEELGVTKSGLLNLHSGYVKVGYSTPMISKVGRAIIISGAITGGIGADTVVVASLPQGFRIPFNFHIFLSSYNHTLPTTARLYVTTDGNLTIHGANNSPASAVLDFYGVIAI